MLFFKKKKKKLKANPIKNVKSFSCDQQTSITNELNGFVTSPQYPNYVTDINNCEVTINPPNYVVPNITVMTGVIESDNLRRGFSFNLKVEQPGITTKIKKGTPIAAFIPVPRYFSDQFEIKNAEDVFSEDVIVEELNAAADANIHRDVMEEILPDNVGKLYKDGIDVYGNQFPDHQKK